MNYTMACAGASQCSAVGSNGAMRERLVACVVHFSGLTRASPPVQITLWRDRNQLAFPVDAFNDQPGIHKWCTTRAECMERFSFSASTIEARIRSVQMPSGQAGSAAISSFATFPRTTGFPWSLSMDGAPSITHLITAKPWTGGSSSREIQSSSLFGSGLSPSSPSQRRPY